MYRTVFCGTCFLSQENELTILHIKCYAEANSRKGILIMDQENSRQKQAAATRKKIFLCAQKLFTQNSYENVKILDICKLAGVSTGAFYHHFPTKESVLNESYRQFDQSLERKWASFTPQSPREAIILLIRCQFDSIHARGAKGAAQYFKNQLTNEEAYILNKNRFFYQTLLAKVEAEVSNGSLQGSAATIADDILRASRGVIYDWCLHHGNYDLHLEGEKFLSMVLQYYTP